MVFDLRQLAPGNKFSKRLEQVLLTLLLDTNACVRYKSIQKQLTIPIFKEQTYIYFSVNVIVFDGILYNVEHYQRIQIPVTYDLDPFFFMHFTIVFKVHSQIWVTDGGLERLHNFLEYYL